MFRIEGNVSHRSDRPSGEYGSGTLIFFIHVLEKPIIFTKQWPSISRYITKLELLITQIFQVTGILI